MSMERQKELLLCLADNQEFNMEQTENVVKAFFAQDLEGIEKAMDAKMNNTCDGTPAEKDMLINNRNAEWIKQMPGIMKQKSTFFAVGAGHLPGDKGVLALLKKQDIPSNLYFLVDKIQADEQTRRFDLSDSN